MQPNKTFAQKIKGKAQVYINEPLNWCMSLYTCMQHTPIHTMQHAASIRITSLTPKNTFTKDQLLLSNVTANRPKSQQKRTLN